MITEIDRSGYQFPVAELDYEENHYYSGSISTQVYGYAHVQKVRHVGHIHFYILIWSRTVLRQLRADFYELKGIIKRMGISLLIGTYEGDDIPKWHKFVMLLGFQEPRNIDGQLMTVMEV